MKDVYVSLVAQDIPLYDYEIICVNDGSPDGCMEVVERLKKEFENIILIDQVNKGVSLARNAGIENSTGKYLLMVDPDDFILPNSLKNKLDIIEQNNLDVGLTGYIILDKDQREEYLYDPDHDSNEIVSGICYFSKYEQGKIEIRDPDRSWYFL